MNENIKAIVDQVGTDSSGKWMSIDKVEELTSIIAEKCISLVDTSHAQHCALTTHDLGTVNCVKQKITITIKDYFNLKNKAGGV